MQTVDIEILTDAFDKLVHLEAFVTTSGNDALQEQVTTLRNAAASALHGLLDPGALVAARRMPALGEDGIC